jgi:hypothetical protein
VHQYSLSQMVSAVTGRGLTYRLWRMDMVGHRIMFLADGFSVAPQLQTVS